jgi:hypothetical protein
MDYNNPTPPSSGSGGDAQTPPDAAGSDQKDLGPTFFLPPDVPNTKDAKPGDELVFRVVGRDEDGNIEVQYAPEKGQGDGDGDRMMDHFDSEVASEPVAPANPGNY